MKIAILRKKYTSHGGAEGYLNNLIDYLIKKGHKVYVYSLKWNKEGTASICYRKLSALPLGSFLRDLTFAISSYFVLKNDRDKLDLIQSHDKTLLQDIYRADDGCHIQWLKERWKRIGLIKKISIFLNPHHWLILLIERIIFKKKKFKKIIAISEMVKQNIIKNYNVNPADIEVIYNGIDIDRFKFLNKKSLRFEIRQRFSISDSDFVVLFVGSSFERKGVKYLIEAAEKVKSPLTILIVGKGPARKYQKYIKKQRVIFCGPQKEVHKFYAASDAFVFPTMYEPFGLVILEALASGLPVITTRLSGASEIISDGTQGFVVNKPENIGEIAQKISYLMDKKENQRMGREAMNLAEKFSFQRHIESIIELYNSMAKKDINH